MRVKETAFKNRGSVRGLKRRTVALLATFFLLGYFPVAPGTAGTLGALAAYYFLLSTLPHPFYILFLILFGTLSAWVSHEALGAFGGTDPKWVVIDEACGILVAMALIPPSPQYALLGFVLFRAFDIIKPPPLGALERLPGGMGIVADDIMAGLYTNVLLHIGGSIAG